MCFTDVAGEFLRVGITSLGLHTWQSVIGASVAHAEQNPLLAAAEVSRILSSMEAEGTSPDRHVKLQHCLLPLVILAVKCK
jgi:hypothetical protein